MQDKIKKIRRITAIGTEINLEIPNISPPAAIPANSAMIFAKFAIKRAMSA